MQRLMILISTGIVLTGCSNWRDTLGINRPVPDEFAVMASPHLTVPDTFDLPEPHPQAPQFKDTRPSIEAKQLLLKNHLRTEEIPMDNELIVNLYNATASLTEGEEPSISMIAAAPITTVEVANVPASKGENLLLKRARAEDVDDSIKKVIFDETVAKKGTESQGFFRNLWNKMRSSENADEPTVNAAAEKERIAKDIKAGRPVTGDEAEIANRGAKGWLQQMLGMNE